MVSGAAHSASTSGGGGGGSEGSPTGRAAPGMQGGGGGGGGATPAASASASTPASETTVARRLDGLDIQGDDAPSSQPATSKKKKRGPGTRATGPDKGGRGLRQFSMKVCEKVESKGRTTYNEVADELVAEFADPNNNFASPDPENPNTPQFDEKNIRRRVYDALNVLMAMDIISKDKKEIQWKGLPRTSMSDVEELKTEIIGLKGRIDKKNAYLQELEDQFVGLQNLAQRNEQLYGSGNAPSGGVALPFILVQTRPHATVEVEISEDMQLVHFDFNSTPFELHDDSFVLKALGFSGKEPDDTQARVGNGGECSTTPMYHQSPQVVRPNGVRLPTSPPIPGPRNTLEYKLLLLALAVSVLIAVAISKLISYATKPRLNLPPGPWTLPVIGSIHHLVWLGEVPAVVVSSPEAAEDVLMSQDLAFADRYVSTTIATIYLGGRDLAFAPYGERWRQLRKLCTQQLLTAARVRSFRRIREEEVARLVRDLAASAAAGEAVNLTAKMAELVNDIVVRCSIDNEQFLDALRIALDQTTWLTVADVFPSSKLARMLGTAPRKALASRKKIERILEQTIQERKQIKERSTGTDETAAGNECFLDVLLRLQKERNTPIPITNETMMLLLPSQRNIKHHSKLDHGRGHQVAKSNGKGAFEVRRAFQGKNTITKDDVVKLSYLKMVTKESLRMHCPVPLLGPESEKIDTREAPGLVEPKRTSLYLHPVTRVAPSTPVTLMLALAVSVSVLLVVVVVISKLVSYATRPRLNLPPGPWTLPVIGSLHHLVRSPSIHRSMRALAEKHGHLMQIRLGEVFAVVVSSPEAAEQILKSQDITFADRFLSTTIGMITFGGNDLAFAPYGERWRQLRKLCTLELLTAARVRSFRRIREEEVARLVRDLATSAAAGEAVNMSDKMAKLTNDIVVRCCVGGRTKYRDEFLDALRVALDQTTWLTVADVFPSSKLAHMLGTAPRRALAGRKKMEHILEQIIQERKEIMDRSSHGGDGEAVNTNECFVDVLLRLQKDGNTPIPITNEIIVDIFSGGSETSSITLNWTMAELVRKPRVIAKAHVEVRQTFQGKNTITEDDGVNRLTYLKMVIKESLRMHCPVPLLGPRKCREKCKVMDYDIPKNTTILVNAWAICRDPTYWDDAEEFKPERFKNNSIGYKGSNFEFLPFGSGRRMCAGMNLGIANVELPLASLLYYFDWKLPDGMLPEDVDMRDAPGLLVKDGWRQPSICCNISGGHLYAGNHIVVCGRIGHRISDPARHRVFLVFSVMFFSRVAACCIWWHLLLTLAVSVVFILISKLVYRDTNKPRLNLPPGPWTLPVIGSIHHLMRSPSIHRSMRSLAEKHGPLMQVWLGEVPAVVVSSTEAAEEVLKNHDVRFADRFISTTLGTITFGGNDLAFAPYGERWRQLKMLCTQELLTAARVRSFRRIREEEVARLVQDLAAGDGEVAVNLSEKIARLVNDIMVRCCVGGRSKHRDEFLDALCTALSQTSWLTVADLFPSSKLARMVGTAPRRALASRKKMEHILEQIIQEREEMMDRSGDGGDSEAVPGNECFLDVLLRLQKEGDTPIPITMELIVMLLFDIVSGGTETSTIVLNWTMAELIHTPRVMAKAHAEVRQTFQAKSTITEDDGISGLTYLKMVIKESLRMHCPVPLLGPRRCRETCKVMGYDILKDTTVFVNAWAMCRSSTYWDDAEEFKPERFENKCIDYKGSSFEFVPFGSGRRMCAGMNLGIADVELPLASLLYHFDWKLPDGMLPKDIDMQEAPGLFGGRRTSLIICPITRVAPSDL
uniref:Uncharacterized protein n=1 Tax=Oryza punctata TaxID=4537 RepID=A0A0E0M818_ORYPU